MSKEGQIKKIEQDWAENPRWTGVTRDYTAADVVRLRGSVQIEHTLARRGAEKLWKLVNEEDYVNCLGAVTGGQAVQQVKGGIKAIYLSGWQVAADGNTSETMYPDQSLYAVDSVPTMVKRINNAFKRADEIQCSINTGNIDFFAPISSFVNKPVKELGTVIEDVQSVAQLRKDNLRLKIELKRLKTLERKSEIQESELIELKKLLKSIPRKNDIIITGRVLSISGGTFAKTMLINAGVKDGIRVGQPVISSEGLVGSIINVGP